MCFQAKTVCAAGRAVNYGPHQWRGDFQFNISRYSQQQLMETSHRHLLHAEGTWLNIDGFHIGDWWRRLSPEPSVSAEFQLSAGRLPLPSWSGVKNNNNRAGHVCPVFR
ncbi:hypothetical protein [Escherichia coli]|uniref:hypothetical protein n=1 Tax=Escherichia coli TaxID=562 RepID=UPI00389011A2